MLTCVVDTNVLLSYILWNGGPAKAVVEHIRANGRMLASEQTLAELMDVVRRPRFDRNGPVADRVEAAGRLASSCIQVQPASTPALCRDPKDDMLLAVALAGKADFLITGDRDLLDLGTIGGTRILTPADVAALLP